MAKEYEPKYSTLYKLSELINKYGANATLEYVFERNQGPNKHKCPKCNGRGYIKCTYNAYPSGLPDSGWVYEEAFKDVKCDVCDGIGYTKEEMIPNYVQEGWKVKQ
jgi:hypothetical protein